MVTIAFFNFLYHWLSNMNENWHVKLGPDFFFLLSFFISRVNSEVTFEMSIRIRQRESEWSLSNGSLAINFSYSMFLPYLFSLPPTAHPPLAGICCDIRWKKRSPPPPPSLLMSAAVREASYHHVVFWWNRIFFVCVCVCGYWGMYVFGIPAGKIDSWDR